MRFVQTADIKPHRCAAIPFIGASHPAGFIDTGSELDGFDNHVYVSVAALTEMVKVMGWPTKEEHTAAIGELERSLARVTELETELEEAERFAESVKWTLGRFGEDVKNKPGRPKKALKEQKQEAA